MSLLAIISSWFGSDEPEALGPDAIAQAYHELRDERADTVFATMGEPRLAEHGGEFARDLYVEVPLYTDTPDNPAPLTFDVTSERLDDFLDAQHVEGIENISVIQGEVTTMERRDGSLVPLWDEDEEGDV